MDRSDFLNALFPERLVNRYRGMGQRPVELDTDECRGLSLDVVETPLLSNGVYLRHDPDALATVLVKIASVDMGSSENAQLGMPSSPTRKGER